MNRLHQRVLSQIKGKYKGIEPLRPPTWLKQSRWQPSFTMSIPGDRRVIAIDIIPSANIPRMIYREEVMGLKKRQPQLRVIVCVMDDGLDSFPETPGFCRKLGCGLQTFIPEVGLRTIVTTDLDQTGEAEVPVEPGWFPKEVLHKTANLTRLSFHKTIDGFRQDPVAISDDEAAVTSLVLRTIDQLLQHYPTCHANIGSFMKLAHFESTFRRTAKGATEHVLHSFRVFLVGCTIINRFYDTFVRAHRRFCLGSERKMSIEYCWLLTAVFHNVGRPMEGGQRMLEAELEDEDIAVSVVGKETRWLKENYRHARRILASLGSFVASGPRGGDEWDAGAVPDDQDNILASDWTNLYDRMASHAVISAFNMLGSIIEQARAVAERKNRPFVVTHATPAALAILLHDWRIWEDARKWKLFPVDSAAIPMAALLIFIDTWDDFKRRDTVSPISVESFSFDARSVSVRVRWHSAEDYEKEKIKAL